MFDKFHPLLLCQIVISRHSWALRLCFWARTSVWDIWVKECCSKKSWQSFLSKSRSCFGEYNICLAWWPRMRTPTISHLRAWLSHTVCHTDAKQSWAKTVSGLTTTQGWDQRGKARRTWKGFFQRLVWGKHTFLHNCASLKLLERPWMKVSYICHIDYNWRGKP